jgi:hypothetical protein
LAPGGEAKVTGQLLDEKGQPVAGTVQAILGDLNAGETLDGLSGLDIRRTSCMAPSERCGEFLGPGLAGEPLRRSVLAGAIKAAATARSSPKATMRTSVDDAFARTLKSLEGAVYEASTNIASLQDVRRRGLDRNWQFNPELLTLTVDAMDPKPETPGGELLTLSDLIAVDSQVTFDNVAKRITRLKLFRVLAKIREFRSSMDPDEPIFAQPNVLLRKLIEG